MKLTLNKETLRKLTVKSAVRAGANAETVYLCATDHTTIRIGPDVSQPVGICHPIVGITPFVDPGPEHAQLGNGQLGNG